MTTRPVNNPTSPLSPLATPSAKDAGAAVGAKPIEGERGVAVHHPRHHGTPSNYDVQISTSGKDRAEAHANALQIARNTPDVRENRVATLKKQIAEGKYKVDSGNIADGMLREAIREHLAANEEKR